MRRLIPFAPFALLIALSALRVTAPHIDPQHYLAHIKYLASPGMKGRETGSPQLEKAAHYIAAQFRSIGLSPVDGKSYMQAFPVTTNARLGSSNHFEYEEAGKSVVLKVREDFIPFNFSSRGKLSGSVVFAGYGITAPEYNYDDYAGLDVKDKLVLVLRHEPQEFDEKSVFSGKAYTEHAQFFSKAVIESVDRKSTRLNSSHSQISYAVFCLKKKIDDRRQLLLVLARQLYDRAKQERSLARHEPRIVRMCIHSPSPSGSESPASHLR